MKFTRMALAATLVCTGAAGTAAAQGVQQPASVHTTGSYSYYNEVARQPSPSDVEIPSLAAGGGVGEKQYGGYGKGLDSCGVDPICDPCCDEPWRLFPQWGDVSLTGWIAAGGTANAHSPASRYNGPVTFNDRDEIQMNQLYAVLEKPIDTDCYCWDIGGRVDLLYGTDYIFTQATGLETTDQGAPQWNSNQHYGLAMPQAYAEVGYGNLSLKLGHFYTIMGYESVMAPANFFYSHAYTMQYGEPFTHTGGLFTWDYSDQVTLYGGLVNGWDKFDAETDKLAFLGGATYTPCHEAYSITFTVITGEEDGAMPPITGNRTLYSLVFAWNVTDNLEYVFQNDVGWQENGVAPGVDAEWYGVNQYLFYTLNDCWKVGARFEWFRDDDGTRVAGVRPGNPYPGGSAGDFYEVTLGLNWSPTNNIIVRPEARWDWFEGAGTLPYDDNTQDNQFLGAVDVIVLW